LLSASIDAAINFNAEFLAPLILTFPDRVFPPFIINFSINIKKVIFPNKKVKVIITNKGELKNKSSLVKNS